MIRFSRKLYDKWHNAVLLAIYRVMDNYASSERARTMVNRTIIWTTVTLLSLLLYFALTHWIPASRTILDFTARDVNKPAHENIPGAPAGSGPAGKIPVEENVQY